MALKYYPSVTSELLAIKEGIIHFRDFLYGKHFTIISDAKSLKYFLKLDKQPDVISRWLLEVSRYYFTFKHIKGENNPSNYLSRNIFSKHMNTELVNNIVNQSETMNPGKIREEQKQDSELLKIIKVLSQKGLKPRNGRAYRIDSTGLLVKQINRINKIPEK